MSSSFLRQTGEALFPNIIWNRPVSRAGAGRLLIVGGHAKDFALPQATFQAAQAGGIGDCNIVLPDSLRALLGHTGIGFFVPSTAAGSMAKGATSEIIHLIEDYDAVMVGPTLSGNSDTIVMAESIIAKSSSQVIVVDDALTSVKFQPDTLTGNPNALIILTMQELFKLATAMNVPVRYQPESGILNKIEILTAVARAGQADYFLIGPDLIVASDDRISVTPFTRNAAAFQAAIYGLAATFWLQNPQQRFEGLTTAAYILQETANEIGDKQTLADQLAAVGKALKTSDRSSW